MNAEMLLTAYAPDVCCQLMARVTKKSKATFADMLRAWRDREGFSQSVAADELGVNVRTLQNWEIARNEPTAFAARVLLTRIAPAKRRR